MTDILSGISQEIISGIALGSIYALIALGFTMIYKATEVVDHFNKTNRSGKIHQIIEILTTSTNQNDKLVCTATYRLVIRGE